MCLLAYVLSERRRHLFSLWGKVREIFIKFITKKKLKKLKKAEKHENDDNKNAAAVVLLVVTSWY